MREAVFLVHEPGNRRVPPGILVPLPRPRHRPPTLHRLRLASPEDVEKARQVRQPVSLLTAERITAFGYPMHFPPNLIVARSLLPAVDTVLPTIPFVDDAAARNPEIEDVIVAMLSVDTLAARALALRNRRFVDPVRLMRRVVREEEERRATLVRLQDVAPTIPSIGPALPREQLDRQDRKNLPRGRLP
ncbi:MAG: hypothetical protein L3J97_01305 [Thermoplasmata archaeon]|nr:hypothetical protein [Thermoplasmata archaeon]